MDKRSQLSIVVAAATAAVAAGGETYGLRTVTLGALLTSKKEPVFTAVMTVREIVNGSDQTNNYTVADDAGKIRRFKDADDFFRVAGALGQTFTGVDVVISNSAVFDPRPFTGDIIAKNQSIMAGYVKRKTAVDERITGLTAQITLAGNTPGMVQSVIDELTAQKVSCEELSQWLAAEIARIDAIVNPAP